MFTTNELYYICLAEYAAIQYNKHVKKENSKDKNWKFYLNPKVYDRYAKGLEDVEEDKFNKDIYLFVNSILPEYKYTYCDSGEGYTENNVAWITNQILNKLTRYYILGK